MNVVRTVADIRRALGPLRSNGRVGLVATMGALHKGHAAMFRAARAACPHVVGTIFVNPTQFNDPADLAAYPRQEAQDQAIAQENGITVLFMPSVDEMYPSGDATTVVMGGPALRFEGAHRPGHFNGVARVCLSLFCIVQPDVAFFGQKDAQQVAVLQRLVRDVHLNLELVVLPTIRDRDGLALSSRNVRLSAEERERSLAIPRALEAGLSAHRRGGDPVAAARAELAGLQVDYVDVASFDEPTLVIAATVGRTRLIDNVPLHHPERAGLA